MTPTISRNNLRAGSVIIEKVTQRASLIGHVIRDLTYEDVRPPGFRAELVGRGETPQYKEGGFFVFSGLRADDYSLKITGERFQPATVKVTVPAQNHTSPGPRGDNELIVIARTVANDPNNPGVRRITFDPVILTRQIRAGAPVISDGLPVVADPALAPALAATLEVGEVSSATLRNAGGLPANSIVRVVRDLSIRMNLDPYYAFESSITRVVGKVFVQGNRESPLEGARVRLIKLNGAPVTHTNVQGVSIFKGVDAGGRAVVLGAVKDISAVTNRNGDYNLYFSNETLAGFKVTAQTITELTNAGAPQSVLNVLEDTALKDKVFRGLERFLKALGEVMRQGGVSDEVLLRHRPLILQHSEGFIRELTLEATLDNFNPAQKTQSINTAQRKVVDFELIRV